jgi:hypothetical protein
MEQASEEELSSNLTTQPGSNGFLQKYPLGQPLERLDGADMRALLHAGHDWLASHYEIVNQLNVFPVPDGDTGTNMLLTIQSAWRSVGTQDGQSVAGVLKAAAEGALQGSRGNSGVIFSQILRGLSQGLQQKVHLSAEDLAAALRQAADAAYSSVPAPVEGTILTVIREISHAAERIVTTTRDLRAVFAHLVQAADQAVCRTPELLPLLKGAGVVDSGGKGLFYVLEGMQRALMGQLVAVVMAATATSAPPAKGNRSLPPPRWGFDVQFLLEQPKEIPAVIRQTLLTMGDSVLVEGDERLLKVHIHVFDPGVVLSYGVQLGFVTDVVVENMDDMAAQERVATAPPPSAPLPPSLAAELTNPAVGAIGLVAVAPGAGFAEVLRNLGVQAVVSGGQAMNPSTAELLEAVRTLPHQRIILLPNNSNILLAAQQAAQLLAGERQVVVVPSKTIPQGIAAVLAFNPAVEELTKLALHMQEHMGQIDTGEVTQAVRTAEFDGVTVEVGDFIGLHDGRLVTRGASVNEVVRALLEQMAADESELITLYFGDFISPHAAENLAEIVRSNYPESAVELAYGGQSHYHYILSTE